MLARSCARMRVRVRAAGACATRLVLVGMCVRVYKRVYAIPHPPTHMHAVGVASPLGHNCTRTWLCWEHGLGADGRTADGRTSCAQVAQVAHCFTRAEYSMY